jgi:hypothetical protein
VGFILWYPKWKISRMLMLWRMRSRKQNQNLFSPIQKTMSQNGQIASSYPKFKPTQIEQSAYPPPQNCLQPKSSRATLLFQQYFNIHKKHNNLEYRAWKPHQPSHVRLEKSPSTILAEFKMSRSAETPASRYASRRPGTSFSTMSYTQSEVRII